MSENIENLEDMVRISPPVWPGKKLEVQPGDLSLFAPMGMGFHGPFPIRPWDDTLSALSGLPSGYYGYYSHTNHPFLGAPISEPAGGVIYFDDGSSESDLQVLLRLLRVYDYLKEYAVFIGHAVKPVEERYLTQLRIVSRYALANVFRAEAGEESKSLLAQNLTIGELVWKFIGNQQQTWGTGMSLQLRGAMGGDGDWAKESLCFGFMVENQYHGIYRIWSRAWLVTK
jgi:hypothetical protein